jgi:hypothetical protein
MVTPDNRDGVRVCAIGRARMLFGNVTSAPAHADDEALAQSAGRHIEELTGLSAPVLYARQRHTNLAFVYAAEAPLSARPHCIGICDALITAETGVALCVRTADCLPVAVVGANVVALVHAGWRGLGADILGAVVRRLELEFGVPPGQLDAVIGVGVGACHYPVGDEVVAALARHRVTDASWRGDGRVDLAVWARGRLRALGLVGERTLVLPGCTACLPGYHSNRRDRERAGRQWSAVLLT